MPVARFTKVAEGVGFEPTVGFPTLDFESSDLNRTQPPFHHEKERRTLNVQHPTSNANAILQMHAMQGMLSERRRGDVLFG